MSITLSPAVAGPPTGEAEVERYNRTASQILVLMVLACLLAAALELWHGPLAVRVAVAYLIVGPCAVALVALLLRLGLWGRSRLPRTAFIVALVFMAGGSVLDVGATAACSPTLAREGNPIARVLLDSGHPLPVVYVIGLLGQFAILLAGAASLAITLRHRESVLSAARAMAPDSASRFVRAGLTGRQPPARRLSVAQRLVVRPRAYNVLCALGACVPAGWVGRWYLGLEWLGAVPVSRAVLAGVVAASAAAAFCAYLYWLERRYVALPGEPGSSPERVAGDSLAGGSPAGLPIR